MNTQKHKQDLEFDFWKKLPNKDEPEMQEVVEVDLDPLQFVGLIVGFSIACMLLIFLEIILFFGVICLFCNALSAHLSNTLVGYASIPVAAIMITSPKQTIIALAYLYDKCPFIKKQPEQKEVTKTYKPVKRSCSVLTTFLILVVWGVFFEALTGMNKPPEATQTLPTVTLVPHHTFEEVIAEQAAITYEKASHENH